MQTLPEDERFDMTGVVVRAHPDKAMLVADQLVALPGVEVHGIGAEGNLVVTIEEVGSEKLAVDTMTKISNLPGVLSTSLIYHRSEDEMH